MIKWVKVAFLAALLVGAGYLLGSVCRQIDQAYGLILHPSRELVRLLLWFLIAVGAVAVAAGLMAALVRPVWVGMIAFALSALAMVLGWKVAVASGLLGLAYLLAGSLYSVGVARELNQRIRFSVRPVSESQGLLLMTLILVACGSLYLGSVEHIRREGFSIPESYVEILMDQVERQIEARVPVEDRQEVVAAFREEFRRALDEFLDQTVKPYEQFIPLAVGIGLFTPLVTITRLLAWVPTILLSMIFPLLKALGVAKVVTETRQVQRLVIG